VKTIKNKILVVRITSKEEAIIKELRKQNSINISSLIRELLNQYYENKKNQ